MYAIRIYLFILALDSHVCNINGLYSCDIYVPAVKPVYNDHIMGYFFAFWS